jgi:para-aminobenzoate synthetase/4-amino-4-deoxychorismate lyase
VKDSAPKDSAPKDSAPSVLLQATEPSGKSRWWHFRDPVEVLSAQRLGDVAPVLAEVERAVDRGLHAAGFLSYEAAPGLDPALEAHPGGPLPLTWWGLFKSPQRVSAPSLDIAGGEINTSSMDWQPLVSPTEYRRAIAEIHAKIAAGETYQINYTFPMETPFAGDALALFTALYAAQDSRHSAYVDTGRFALCSISPELFFVLDGDSVTTRPMKGTAPRGRYGEEDRRAAIELTRSAKERAENVMIVDMMRNDLGKIAQSGSVQVDELFRLETYPTLHQLTSTVRARTTASWSELLRALFPCASITGAPKVAATTIIRQLEKSPRGAYTGSIGYLAPGRRAYMNVAIRTVTVDRQTSLARYGTGGGVVWDSDAGREYEECRTKALVLGAAPPTFELFETLLWRPASGYFLLERHLERLAASASYFGFPWDEKAVRRRLGGSPWGESGEGHARVRFALGRDGSLAMEVAPLAAPGRQRWKIGLDSEPVDSRDIFLFHKTSRRQRYEEALLRRPDLDEVILWNERGELTESTRANLILRVGGECLTPSVSCGLLGGAFRAELLRRGRLRVEVLPVARLEEADEILLINALRGFIPTVR